MCRAPVPLPGARTARDRSWGVFLCLLGVFAAAPDGVLLRSMQKGGAQPAVMPESVGAARNLTRRLRIHRSTKPRDLRLEVSYMRSHSVLLRAVGSRRTAHIEMLVHLLEMGGLGGRVHGEPSRSAPAAPPTRLYDVPKLTLRCSLLSAADGCGPQHHLQPRDHVGLGAALLLRGAPVGALSRRAALARGVAEANRCRRYCRHRRRLPPVRAERARARC